MRTLLLATSMTVGLSGAALAQYVGPTGENAGDNQTYTPAAIADIVANPNDGDHVTVEGMLVRKVDDETYVLSDGTNEINVEIDDDDFPKVEISETTKVVIEGEVDTHLVGDADIEADRIQVVQ